MDSNLRKVLSQAMRAELLERIAKHPISARQLAESTGLPLSKVTYHTTVLCRADCIRPLDPAHTDPGERLYEIASLIAVPERLPLSDDTRGRAMSSILRRLVERGRAALEAGALDHDRHRLSCQSMLLDEQGLREARAILDDAAERIAATRASTARRIARNGTRGISATVALAAFESPEEEERSV